MNGMIQRVTKQVDPAILIVSGVVILMSTVGCIISDDFRTARNFMNVFDNSVALGLVALGQTLVLLTGGIDLSVGGVINLTSCLTSGIINGNTMLFVPVVFGVILLGILIGFLNGTMTVWLGVHPLIVTLGMSIVLQGVTFMYALAPPGAMPLFYDYVAYARIWGIPVAPMVLVLIYLAVGLFLRKMRLGRYIYAVGGNPNAARLTGIMKNRVLVFVYAVSGFFAALSGLYLVSRMGIGDPKIGDNFMLQSITPVVLGGTTLAGGKGGIWGTLIGVYLLIMVRNLLNFMDISSYYQWIIEGLIIIIAVSFYVEKR